MVLDWTLFHFLIFWTIRISKFKIFIKIFGWPAWTSSYTKNIDVPSRSSRLATQSKRLETQSPSVNSQWLATRLKISESHDSTRWNDSIIVQSMNNCPSWQKYKPFFAPKSYFLTDFAAWMTIWQKFWLENAVLGVFTDKFWWFSAELI